MCKVFFFLFVIIVVMIITTIEPFESGLKNVYGEPLQPCRKNSNDNLGSWDKQGYCSEMIKGVHQICFDVTNKTSDFSIETGQNDWSEGRVNKNHCMCLGAWALYKAKGKGTWNELLCDAIPENALSVDYIETWNTWNGNELPDQIQKGVDALYTQCKAHANYDTNKINYLQDKYDILMDTYTN